MTQSKPLALYCRQLSKTFGGPDNSVMALRGVDLDVAFGELTMLVGPSGCGKTTLISVIAGILDATSGQCDALGQDLTKLTAAQKTQWRGKNVGFVFQAYNLIPALSSLENVAVPLLVSGVPQKQAIKKAADMLDRVGLSHRAGHLPATLSGGQQQRVAIARALIHRPKLLVCDEPTSALDHETGQQIMRLMRSVAAEEDRALIVVTHDTRIYGYADCIARMDDGQIVDVIHGAAITELNAH